MNFLLLGLLLGFTSATGEEKTLPYLGPGSDKLTKQEYERIYKNYIQTSILLGYPFLKELPKACDQALGAVFRQAGLFGYPVPAEAPQVRKSTAKAGGKTLETYELGGMLLQLSRLASGAPERLLWINSSSPKASRRLLTAAQKEPLLLEKDPVTGLERVKGVPVGYPHPLLNPSGQGLYVKVLKFNGKKDDCLPVDYFDNAWQGGFELGNQRCQELQADAEAVWAEKMPPAEFRERELKRMKERAYKNALAHGMKAEEAGKLVEKHFVPPFTSEINVVGSAMRNLAQCNLLALGRKESTRPEAAPAKPSLNAPDSSSAQ